MGDDKEMLNELVGLAANVPAPVQTAFVKTLGRLLGGLTALPEGWIRRRVQAYDDVTNARSAVAAVLAKGVAENALADPITMRAATEIYLPNEIRKSRNKVQIAQLAAEEIQNHATDDAAASPPSDDWMNAFTRLAEDASSEELQTLFARILAGEVVQPGSYSRATLRAVSELDKELAEQFTLMWERSTGREVDFTNEFEQGEWYSRWKTLAECGLIMGEASARFIPETSPGQEEGLWSPVRHDGHLLMIKYPVGQNLQWTHIPFTRVGRELGSILPPPDYRQNMKKVGLALKARYSGVQVRLYYRNDPPETL